MQIKPRARTGPIITKTSGRALSQRNRPRPRAQQAAGVEGIPLPEGVSPDNVTIIETGERWQTRSKGIAQTYLEDQ